MNTEVPPADPRPVSHEEWMSALFANLVMQNTNMAMMFLGQVPNPETGERMQDLETARMFIDQLEMLELKTKGNLTKAEDQLLKQSLTSLRMAFVHASDHPLTTTTSPANAESETPPAPAPAPEAPREPAGTSPETADEAASRKKFSKSYGG